MSIPIFKLPKITHDTVKHRKDFITDCLFIQTAITILETVLKREVSLEGIKPMHPNKHRKQIKKIKEIYEELSEKRKTIMYRLDDRDLNTIEFKNKDKVARSFILNIATFEKNLSFEYLAPLVLSYGLKRENRKTPLHPELKPFAYFRTHGKILKEVESAIQEERENEEKVAKNFVREVRY